MSNWLANKGAGPWPFQAQPDKLGYVNNPRWTGAPASAIEHEPCGYWLKGSTENTVHYGLLWGTGDGSQYQFGTGTATTVNTWFNLLGDPQFSHVVYSALHSASVHRDGSLYVTGTNSSGQLGLGDYSQRTSWTKVPGLIGVKQAAIGETFTAILKSDGTIWATGLNTSGQLGQGDTTTRNVFTQIGTASNWVRVACGGSHLLALNNVGELWGCGLEAITTPYDWNALGLGSPVYPYYRKSLTLLISAGVRSMSGASEATMVLKTDGTIHSTGYNQSGRLAVGDVNHRVAFTPEITLGSWVALSAGYDHTGALKSDGTVWCAGENGSGQLGLGDTTNRYAFTQVGTDSDWAQITALYMHTFAIKHTGTLWATGRNTQGELGLGDNSDRLSFVKVGTGNDWLAVNESASYVTREISLAVRKALDVTTITGVRGANPVWPMPS